MSKTNSQPEPDMVIPRDMDYDYFVGYLAGQRTAHLNAFLNQFSQKNIADLRYAELSSQTVSLVRYRSGFRHGYHDELWGLAHPLPANDVPYDHNQF